MSDTSQGPGWWLASDGKWYPPELWTGPPDARPGQQPGQESPATGSVHAPQVQTPSAQTPGAQAPGAQAPGGYPGRGTAPAYGQYPQYPQSPQSAPYSGYSAPSAPSPYRPAARKRTNGFAIASLVCGIAGFFLLSGLLGIVFGFIARSQIRQSGGAQGGDGFALAGILCGFGWIALVIIVSVVSASINTNGVVAVHLGTAGVLH